MISYDVPMIVQETSNVCWHASARMIYAFKRKACAHPLPSQYRNNHGITPAQFVVLARELGLRTIPAINMSMGAAYLESVLRRHGPLWCAGYWDRLPHVIVLTGVIDDANVFFNDPSPARRERLENSSWFNSRVASDVSNPLMFVP